MIEYCSLIVFVKLCAGLPAPHVGVRNCFFQFGVSGLVRICIWREGEKNWAFGLLRPKQCHYDCIGKFTASPMISFQRESTYGNLVVTHPSHVLVQDNVALFWCLSQGHMAGKSTLGHFLYLTYIIFLSLFYHFIFSPIPLNPFNYIFRFWNWNLN